MEFLVNVKEAIIHKEQDLIGKSAQGVILPACALTGDEKIGGSGKCAMQRICLRLFPRCRFFPYMDVNV